MNNVFCNGCFAIFNKEKLFSLTDCSHVFCSDCLPRVGRYNCKVCKRKFNQKVFIGRQMPPMVQLYFRGLSQNFRTFEKIFRFQRNQVEVYMGHLLKENARLKRLNSCFKKRIEFLKKNSSASAHRQMYTNIKQEPVDDDFMTTFSGDEASTDLFGNMTVGNVDWNHNLTEEDEDDYDKKPHQYDDEGGYNHQMVDLTEDSGHGLSSDMKNMIINKPKVIQRAEKEATIDRFFPQKNNFMNRATSQYYPPKNSMNGSIATVNYPGTVITTRPINANSFNGYNGGL